MKSVRNGLSSSPSADPQKVLDRLKWDGSHQPTHQPRGLSWQKGGTFDKSSAPDLADKGISNSKREAKPLNPIEDSSVKCIHGPAGTGISPIKGSGQQTPLSTEFGTQSTNPVRQILDFL
jgi:hypothetical protein